MTKEKSINLYSSTTPDPVEAKIIKFIDRMDLVREDANYPGSNDWNYSEDSTLWYIEAALNYTYAGQWLYDGNETHSDLYDVDSSFSQVAPNGTDYNIVALQQSYDVLAAKLENQYTSLVSDHKFFVVSDIINQGVSDNGLELKQYSVLGKANQVLPQNGWKWGLGLGDCSGGNQGLDATDIIENKLSLSRYYLQTPTGYVGYVNVSVNFISGIGEPLPSGQANPTIFWDYLLFIYTNANGNPCLSDNDMIWYKNNILSLETKYLPYNKKAIFSDVVYGLSTGTGASDIILHDAITRYGEEHIYSYNTPIN